MRHDGSCNRKLRTQCDRADRRVADAYPHSNSNSDSNTDADSHSDAHATPTPTPSVLTIEINGMLGGNSYSPNPANVQVGQQVRWHNGDSTVHTATQNGGGFDTGLISAGATSAPITITTAGALNYHCTVHPSMVGTLNVTQ